MSDYHDENDIKDLGLQADLAMWQKKPLERRRILQLGVVGIGALPTSCSSAAGSRGEWPLRQWDSRRDRLSTFRRAEPAPRAG